MREASQQRGLIAERRAALLNEILEKKVAIDDGSGNAVEKDSQGAS